MILTSWILRKKSVNHHLLRKINDLFTIRSYFVGNQFIYSSEIKAKLS